MPKKLGNDSIYGIIVWLGKPVSFKIVGIGALGKDISQGISFIFSIGQLMRPVNAFFGIGTRAIVAGLCIICVEVIGFATPPDRPAFGSDEVIQERVDNDCFCIGSPLVRKATA